MMTTILEIHGLSKSYDGKKEALANCSFTLKMGKICAVVGESGSGKSTLLRLIAGLERPCTGSIKINDTVVSHDTHIELPQKRNIGFVFQDFSLFPHLTVAQNIAFGIKKNKQEQVDNLLQLVKMQEYHKAYPSQLSGGQKQRVALARTLAIQPELLLLDEPFSNLDAALKSELRREIKNIVNQVGTSMLFITHDIFDAIDIADEIIFLKEGRILQHSPIEEFAQNIAHEEVDKIISDLKYSASRTLQLISK